MKARHFLTLMAVFLFSLFLCKAQSPILYALKSDIPVTDQIEASHQYLFPGFTRGTALFNKERVASAAFNYNFLLDEIQYMNAQNKKMAIANADELVSVAIGAHVFRYLHHGYFEELEPGKISLLKKRQATLQTEGKSVGYGMTSSTSAVNSLDYTNSSDGRPFKLSIAGEYRLTIDSSCWISNGRRMLRAGNLKSYIRLLPKQEKDIMNFVSSHSLDLRKEEDMKLLVSHCNELVPKK